MLSLSSLGEAISGWTPGTARQRSWAVSAGRQAEGRAQPGGAALAARIRARDASWTSFSFEEHSFRVGQSFVGNAALALVAAGQLFSSSASQCSYAATRVEAEGCRPEFPHLAFQDHASVFSCSRLQRRRRLSA